MTLKSMTGFARVRESIGGVELVISIKSVNHRGLDVHFYTGAELDPFETAMRASVKRFVGRGHVDIRTQITRAGVNGPLAVDSVKLDAYVTAYQTAAAQYGISTPVDLNAAFRVPGMLSEAAIVVKRKHLPNQIWSVEKIQNKLVDMRELYTLWRGPEIPTVRQCRSSYNYKKLSQSSNVLLGVLLADRFSRLTDWSRD